MQNKHNRWLDVQVVIAAMALTFMLSLWNLLAGGNRTSVAVAGLPSISKARHASRLQEVQQMPTDQPAQLPQISQPSGPIYLGGASPLSQAPLDQSAPAPVTSTGSSRP